MNTTPSTDLRDLVRYCHFIDKGMKSIELETANVSFFSSIRSWAYREYKPCDHSDVGNDNKIVINIDGIKLTIKLLK